MDFRDYYRGNVTYISHADPRIERIVEIVARSAPAHVLDVGCGDGYLLDRIAPLVEAKLVGTDVFEALDGKPWDYVASDATAGLPFEPDTFDCVIAGEIIEHVPNPDFFLRELWRVLRPGGRLVISTPNMVSWANRILVPLGVQPLGTETSSEVALGRRFHVLGQGNQVQGHLKVFTHRALGEILDRCGFRVVERYGVPAEFPYPVSLVDRFFTRWVSLASGLLYVARPAERLPELEPPKRKQRRRRGKNVRGTQRRTRESGTPFGTSSQGARC